MKNSHEKDLHARWAMSGEQPKPRSRNIFYRLNQAGDEIIKKMQLTIEEGVQGLQDPAALRARYLAEGIAQAEDYSEEDTTAKSTPIADDSLEARAVLKITELCQHLAAKETYGGREVIGRLSTSKPKIWNIRRQALAAFYTDHKGSQFSKGEENPYVWKAWITLHQYIFLLQMYNEISNQEIKEVLNELFAVERLSALKIDNLKPNADALMAILQNPSALRRIEDVYEKLAPKLAAVYKKKTDKETAKWMRRYVNLSTQLCQGAVKVIETAVPLGALTVLRFGIDRINRVARILAPALEFATQVKEIDGQAFDTVRFQKIDARYRGKTGYGAALRATADYLEMLSADLLSFANKDAHLEDNLSRDLNLYDLQIALLTRIVDRLVIKNGKKDSVTHRWIDQRGIRRLKKLLLSKDGKKLRQAAEQQPEIYIARVAKIIIRQHEKLQPKEASLEYTDRIIFEFYGSFVEELKRMTALNYQWLGFKVVMAALNSTNETSVESVYQAVSLLVSTIQPRYFAEGIETLDEIIRTVKLKTANLPAVDPNAVLASIYLAQLYRIALKLGNAGVIFKKRALVIFSLVLGIVVGGAVFALIANAVIPPFFLIVSLGEITFSVLSGVAATILPLMIGGIVHLIQYFRLPKPFRAKGMRQLRRLLGTPAQLQRELKRIAKSETPSVNQLKALLGKAVEIVEQRPGMDAPRAAEKEDGETTYDKPANREEAAHKLYSDVLNTAKGVYQYEIVTFRDNVLRLINQEDVSEVQIHKAICHFVIATGDDHRLKTEVLQAYDAIDEALIAKDHAHLRVGLTNYRLLYEAYDPARDKHSKGGRPTAIRHIRRYCPGGPVAYAQSALQALSDQYHLDLPQNVHKDAYHLHAQILQFIFARPEDAVMTSRHAETSAFYANAKLRLINFYIKQITTLLSIDAENLNPDQFTKIRRALDHIQIIRNAFETHQTGMTANFWKPFDEKIPNLKEKINTLKLQLEPSEGAKVLSSNPAARQLRALKRIEARLEKLVPDTDEVSVEGETAVERAAKNKEYQLLPAWMSEMHRVIEEKGNLFGIEPRETLDIFRMPKQTEAAEEAGEDDPSHQERLQAIETTASLLMSLMEKIQARLRSQSALPMDILKLLNLLRRVFIYHVSLYIDLSAEFDEELLFASYALKLDDPDKELTDFSLFISRVPDHKALSAPKAILKYLHVCYFIKVAEVGMSSLKSSAVDALRALHRENLYTHPKQVLNELLPTVFNLLVPCGQFDKVAVEGSEMGDQQILEAQALLLCYAFQVILSSKPRLHALGKEFATMQQYIMGPEIKALAVPSDERNVQKVVCKFAATLNRAVRIATVSDPNLLRLQLLINQFVIRKELADFNVSKATIDSSKKTTQGFHKYIIAKITRILNTLHVIGYDQKAYATGQIEQLGYVLFYGVMNALIHWKDNHSGWHNGWWQTRLKVFDPNKENIIDGRKKLTVYGMLSKLQRRAQKIGTPRFKLDATLKLICDHLARPKQDEWRHLDDGLDGHGQLPGYLALISKWRSIHRMLTGSNALHVGASVTSEAEYLGLLDDMQPVKPRRSSSSRISPLRRTAPAPAPAPAPVSPTTSISSAAASTLVNPTGSKVSVGQGKLFDGLTFHHSVNKSGEQQKEPSKVEAVATSTGRGLEQKPQASEKSLVESIQPGQLEALKRLARKGSSSAKVIANFTEEATELSYGGVHSGSHVSKSAATSSSAVPAVAEENLLTRLMHALMAKDGGASLNAVLALLAEDSTQVDLSTDEFQKHDGMFNALTVLLRQKIAANEDTTAVLNALYLNELHWNGFKTQCTIENLDVEFMTELSAEQRYNFVFSIFDGLSNEYPGNVSLWLDIMSALLCENLLQDFSGQVPVVENEEDAITYLRRVGESLAKDTDNPVLNNYAWIIGYIAHCFGDDTALTIKWGNYNKGLQLLYQMLDKVQPAEASSDATAYDGPDTI